MATPPAMHTTAGQQGEAENLRLSVARQPTVGQSVLALLQAVCAVIGEALEKGDPSKLQAFCEHIGADPKSWSDAVVANTPDAAQSGAPFVGLPSEVQEAFAKYAMHAKEQAGQQQAQHGTTQSQGQPARA